MRHGKGLSALLLLTPRQKANEFNNMPTYRFDCQRQHFRCGASTLKHVPRPTTGTSTLKLKQRRRENVDYNSWSTFVSSLYSLQLAHAKCRFPPKFTPMSLARLSNCVGWWTPASVSSPALGSVTLPSLGSPRYPRRASGKCFGCLRQSHGVPMHYGEQTPFQIMQTTQDFYKKNMHIIIVYRLSTIVTITML